MGLCVVGNLVLEPQAILSSYDFRFFTLPRLWNEWDIRWRLDPHDWVCFFFCFILRPMSPRQESTIFSLPSRMWNGMSACGLCGDLLLDPQRFLLRAYFIPSVRDRFFTCFQLATVLQ